MGYSTRATLSLPMGVLSVTLSLATPALAQRSITQDTMSTTTPVGVSCGFCATEAYGVVFRELGTGGLRPSDFPLSVLSVSLALGAAQVTAGACHGQAMPSNPDTLVHVEIWAGTTVTDATDVHALPVMGMPWPGEDLVFTQDAVPVTMSVPTTDGGANFDLMLNTLALGDATNPAPMVDATHTYLRVVVGLGTGGMSSTCAPATNAPTGFPARDDDGVVAMHRSFIYAMGGAGWLWNEAAGVHGDWGIRLSVQSGPPRDAGPVDATVLDSGATRDASMAADAGMRRDTGPIGSGGEAHCGCRVGMRTSSSTSLIVFSAIALMLYSRKVTRPKRAGTWKSPSSGADQPAPR